MKYHGNTDFMSENLHLRRTPKNATEADAHVLGLQEKGGLI